MAALAPGRVNNDGGGLSKQSTAGRTAFLPKAKRLPSTGLLALILKGAPWRRVVASQYEFAMDSGLGGRCRLGLAGVAVG